MLLYHFSKQVRWFMTEQFMVLDDDGNSWSFMMVTGMDQANYSRLVNILPVGSAGSFLAPVFCLQFL